MLEVTLHFCLKAQALVDVGADAVQARAEVFVAVLLVAPARLVARVQPVAAVGHGGDPHLKLSEHREQRRCLSLTWLTETIPSLSEAAGCETTYWFVYLETSERVGAAIGL